MWGITASIRRLRAAAAALLLLCVPLLASGCAATGYAGIPLAAGAADPELQSLAQRARAGDKQAQLELGIRYEEGRGVPVDLARARRLYRLAARDSGGTIWVYSPPVGENGRGQVIPLNTGVPQSGLREALLRLDRIEGRRGANAAGEARSSRSGETEALRSSLPIDVIWRRIVNFLRSDARLNAGAVAVLLGIRPLDVVPGDRARTIHWGEHGAANSTYFAFLFRETPCRSGGSAIDDVCTDQSSTVTELILLPDMNRIQRASRATDEGRTGPIGCVSVQELTGQLVNWVPLPRGSANGTNHLLRPAPLELTRQGGRISITSIVGDCVTMLKISLERKRQR